MSSVTVHLMHKESPEMVSFLESLIKSAIFDVTKKFVDIKISEVFATKVSVILFDFKLNCEEADGLLNLVKLATHWGLGEPKEKIEVVIHNTLVA